LDGSRDELLGKQKRRHMLERGAVERGFTLIEVMISITVLGIILMIGLPSFASWLQNQQLRAASEGLLNGLQTARAEAIRRNLLVQIVVGPGTGWSVTEAVSTAPIQTRVKEEGSPNAVLTVTPNTATTVTFTSLGSVAANLDASPTAGLFDISNPAGGSCQPAGPMRCLRVVVSGGGSLRMCDRIVSLPDPRAC
jgi:type IV fimbrial biogenesis protein FimT